MQVTKQQMIELVLKMDKPYRCRFCIWNYELSCSSKVCCDIGIERFFSCGARTLSQAIEMAEDYSKRIKEREGE